MEVTPELVALGRDAFYLETYGNEVFFTDVLGAIDGPINLWTLGKAIIALKGGYTTNLQVKLDRDAVIGGRFFPKGTRLSTGLDARARLAQQGARRDDLRCLSRNRGPADGQDH